MPSSPAQTPRRAELGEKSCEHRDEHEEQTENDQRNADEHGPTRAGDVERELGSGHGKGYVEARGAMAPLKKAPYAGYEQHQGGNQPAISSHSWFSLQTGQF